MNNNDELLGIVGFLVLLSLTGFWIFIFDNFIYDLEFYNKLEQARKRGKGFAIPEKKSSILSWIKNSFDKIKNSLLRLFTR